MDDPETPEIIKAILRGPMLIDWGMGPRGASGESFTQAHKLYYEALPDRDIEVLAEYGFVRKNDEGRFVPTPRGRQFCLRTKEELKK